MHENREAECGASATVVRECAQTRTGFCSLISSHGFFGCKSVLLSTSKVFCAKHLSLACTLNVARVFLRLSYIAHSEI